MNCCLYQRQLNVSNVLRTRPPSGTVQDYGGMMNSVPCARPWPLGLQIHLEIGFQSMQGGKSSNERPPRLGVTPNSSSKCSWEKTVGWSQQLQRRTRDNRGRGQMRGHKLSPHREKRTSPKDRLQSCHFWTSHFRPQMDDGEQMIDL